MVTIMMPGMFELTKVLFVRISGLIHVHRPNIDGGIEGGGGDDGRGDDCGAGGMCSNICGDVDDDE